MQLAGVPMKAFVKPEIEKLAKFVMTRDLSREEFGRLFRAELDATRTSTFSARAFTDAMKRLNGADFEITEVQVPGKKRVSIESFLNGYQPDESFKFSS